MTDARNAVIGRPVRRYEAEQKVSGSAIYAADNLIPGAAYGFLTMSPIARGQITSIDTSRATSVRGVLEVVTYLNAPTIKPVPTRLKGGHMASSVIPLASNRIYHAGQITGVVIAETLEAAREAAALIKFEYRSDIPAAALDSTGTEIVDASSVQPTFRNVLVGEPERAFNESVVTIDERYSTPSQVHNAMELYSSTAQWSGDQLTVYEPTQFVHSLQHGIAQQLGISPEKVRVINPFMGGAFGGKGNITAIPALTALLARKIGRPVKLVATREQGFTVSTFRAETQQRVRLSADPTGKLTSYLHDGLELTSRTDDSFFGGMRNAAEIYAIPNIKTDLKLGRADRGTPGFMRAPADFPYMYALESAIDELSYKLGMDPIEVRRLNDTKVSPVDGSPYSSRGLMECFDKAAERFGWQSRKPAPRSMSDGDWLIGWGCAASQHPVLDKPSMARVRFHSTGRAKVEVAGHDVGAGAQTVMAQIAADKLNIPYENVTVAMGDSRLPPAPIAGGSAITGSVGSAVANACDRIAQLFGGTIPSSAERDAAFERLGRAFVEEIGDYSPGTPGAGVKALYEGRLTGYARPGPKRLMFSFGAQFVEVRINRFTREIRVPRMVAAFAAGRIINPKTAQGQFVGGMIWGLSSALHEFMEIDPTAGRYVNANLAEYLLPVCADVLKVEVDVIPEIDTAVNPIGVKGIGELGVVGTAAAVANAVYHATGKRVRQLPITLDKLF